MPQGKKIFVNKVILDYGSLTVQPTSVLLLDGIVDVSTTLFRVQMANNHNSNNFYDFEGCPRAFNTSIILYWDSAIGLLDYFGVDIFGWIEDL